MEGEGKAFEYSRKTYQLITTEQGLVQVYQVLKSGLKPVHGQAAFRIVQAYRRKVEGVKALRKPRTFAKKPKRRFR